MMFLCLEFINSRWFTSHKPFEDPLRSGEWLRGFCQRWNLPLPVAVTTTGSLAGTPADLRDFLAQVVVDFCDGQAVSSENLHKLNGILEPALFHKKLALQDGKLTLAVAQNDAGCDGFTYSLVLSTAELLSGCEADRLKVCGNPACGWVFYDESKNRTRKWCDDTCATLIKVRRLRARRKAQEV